MMRRVLPFLALPLLVACDGETDEPDASTDEPDATQTPPEDPFREDCESLNPEFCALPMPSDYFLVDDASTATGHRLAIGETTLPRANVMRRQHIDPTPVNDRDGWSVNAHILAYLPGATAEGLPSPLDIGTSLEGGSKTVLLNAETGERVPHFSQIDESVADESAPRAFIVRPVVPLEHSTRYVVAIRGVVDQDGAELPAPDTFAALRDDAPTEVATIDARRDHFEEIFTILGDAGVAREGLQLAWDFTTGSLETDTAWMLSVRDQALAAVGDDGPDFEITEVQEFTEEENDDIAKRIRGVMTVPLFLDQPGGGAVLNFGDDGMPEQNGTADYPFVINVPRNATPDNKMHPLQYGHGLLGTREQANAGWLAEFGNENGFIPFGVDWIGMSEDDVAPITVALANGTLEDFRTVPERGVQGVVNFALAMRMMLGGMAEDPNFQVEGETIIDTSEGFYTGDSQGGIFGATYMAITTDVERGILGVPGMPYSLLLNRSVDFDPYLNLLQRAFDDGVVIQIAIATMQMLWDRSEPGSYARHIMDDPLPGTPSHRVILQVALGDHQVSTLGAHIMARAVGAVTIEPQTRSIWGIEEVAGPHEGSAIVEWDFGLPPDPVENVPQRMGSDPHGRVRRNPRALEQTLHFYRTGEVIHTCDGVCDPE
ncbi:MAG TPA: hypothetical protein RMH99_14900 [Sandaracinaceae bacterium LLY-WYZ-13_1]|nr:hypothetical protein [Sandaracinaceae bacterium LLY-WYZ-13_1]